MRSVNGQDFEAIAQIEAAGNSKEVLHYQFMDEQAPFGLTYYRLDQTDFDGTTSSSNIITLVRQATAFELTSIIPVPASDYSDVSFVSTKEATINIILYDITGRLLLNQSIVATKGNNIYRLDLRAFPCGYLYCSIE